MDAHVFRRVAQALIPLLTGSRLEKIQSPAPEVCVFSLFTQRGKVHLVLRHGRKYPFLFCTDTRPAAGVAPAASIMRLRRHCAGRRVAAVEADWLGRRLALLFQAPAASTGSPHPPETWLLLDMREGPQLLLGRSPQDPTQGERWPTLEELPAALAAWREWPVLTPALRRVLPHLEPLEQVALLADLQEGGGDLFVYGPAAGEVQGEGVAQVVAWPLPPALRGGWGERVYQDPLAAVGALGGALVLGEAASRARQAAARPCRREAARLVRLLEKLDDEERRLTVMCAVQRAALAVQGELWRYPADARLAEVPTADPDNPVVALDKRYTLRENMQRLFHQAARGRRGLPHVLERRERLQKALRAAQAAAQAIASGAPPPAGQRALDGLGRGPARAGSVWPRGVQGFRSSDGFLVLRGRDAKGNAALLRLASGHDLWLHVEGGPSAHVLIRRSFAGEEVPWRTLEEAGMLAAIKSWQKDSPDALILCAEARHVKAMRGAAPGTVRIDKVRQTFSVTPDAGIDERLCMSETPQGEGGAAPS